MENSLDFLQESLQQYLVADERYCHLEEHCVVNNKKKWKMAFVNLVQATELLMKHILSEIAWPLLEVNIDKPCTEEKTITFSQCTVRMKKFSSIELSDEDISYLNNCAKLRNKFVHFVVDTSSEEIKPKYAELFVLYKKMFEESLKMTLYVEGIKRAVIEDLFWFAYGFTIYRGIEIPKMSLQEFKDEITDAQNHPNFIDKRGVVVQRIKFGAEDNISYSDNGPNIYKFNYCDGCSAKQGEYHLYHCDLEQCPICGKQALSCDCGLKWEET